MPQRNEKGQYKQTRVPWTPDDWDAGYIDKQGRMRVYRPDYPRAWTNGYAFRAHIVWWLSVDSAVPSDIELHHIDHNRLNDIFPNLAPLTRSQHRSTHQENWVHCKCEHCGKDFRINAWRFNQTGGKRRFCSNSCRNTAPRPELRRRVDLICGACGKTFEVIRYQAKTRKACSVSCAKKLSWMTRRK